MGFGRVIMEDPVSFDVWGKVKPHNRSLAVKEITALHPEMTKMGVRLMVNRSVAKDESILVLENQGWDFVKAFQKLSSDWLEGISIYDRYGSPDKQNQYCAIHELNYNNRLGCYVCRNFSFGKSCTTPTN
jgi:hypothetical protein